MPSTLYLRLLGTFQLLSGASPVMAVNTPRLQSLLSYLALHRDAPQPRRQIAFRLWPDLPETRARANLRKLFYQLQQALPQAGDFLCADAHTLQWRPNASLKLDVAEFEAQLTLSNFERAVDLYAGDLFPDCYDEWIILDRERLRHLYLSALEQLIHRAEAAGDYVAAVRHSRRLLQWDPLREEVHRHLMQLHLLNGDRAAALHAFQNCVTVLRRELDVEPCLATRQVYEQLLERPDYVPSSLPFLCALPLVGRSLEWACLQKTWRAAAQGRAHMALLTGEAGIGKTRLAEELLSWVDRQSFSVSSTHCYAAEGTLAYAPVLTWLRDRLTTHLEPVWLAEVARLAPELADHAPGPLTESWQRQRFREALARAVLGPDLGASLPLLLLIEDLHWCDCETLEWLHYLLRLNPRARLLLVGTLRSEMLLQEGALDVLLADLRRQNLVTEIALGPLTLDETVTLGEQVLGQALDSIAAQRLYRETEGNPLFVVEFTQAGMIASDGIRAEDDASVLSPPVQAAVAARLAQLTPAARQVLDLAAVIGRKFTFAVLAAAGEMDATALIPALDELWRRRIIREHGKDDYDFSHNKLLQVVYAGLSGTRCRWLHRRVAEALSAMPAQHIERVSGQIARHYELAGDVPLAVHWLQQAGATAMRVGALGAALDYFDRALVLLPEADLTGRYELVLASEKIYRLQVARESQLRALALLERLAAALADPYRQAEVALERGHYWREISDFPNAIQAAQAAQAALERLPKEAGVAPVRLEFEIYYLWGATLEYQGDHALAAAVEQKSLDLARSRGLRHEEARALYVLAHTISTMAEARACLAAALPIFREVGDQAGETGCEDSLGYVHLWMGDYDAALAHYEPALQLARQIHYRRGEVNVLFHLGHFYNHLGDYRRGREYLEQAVDMARQDQDRRRIAYHLVSIGVSERGLGQIKTAREYALEALSLFQEIGDSRGEIIAGVMLGNLYMDLARWDESVTALRRALALSEAASSSYDVVHCRAGLARALLGAGDLPQAQEQIVQVLRHCDNGEDVVNTEAGPVPIYMSCYQVLRACGDPRAEEMLAAGYAYLQNQSARIHDATLRQSFLNQKLENRELLSVWKQHFPTSEF